MDFSDPREAFRREVGEWLDRELTDEIRELFVREIIFLRVPMDGWPPKVLEFNRKLGAKGWIGLHWPTKYGGGGRSLRDQLVVVEELAARYARIIFGQSLHVTNILLAHGTEQQKMEVIPRVVTGGIEISLGYTEPNAGSDVANIQMRAVEKDDHFIISGEKIFNSAAHCAAYHWMLARTDPSAPKHRGLTMFLVDLKTPGITVRPISTIDDSRTNAVYYDEVKVPKTSVVGAMNRGFYVAMEALGQERLFVFNPYFYRALYSDIVEYARTSRRNGRRLAEDPIVRHVLAELDAKISAADLLYKRVLWMLENKKSVASEVSMFKMFMAETGQELVRRALDIIGPVGLLRPESRRSVIRGLVEMGQQATIFHTFGGGASELMRNIIAVQGYGLPRN